MNYAAAFMVLILAVATGWWFVHGNRVYTGPVMQAEVGSHAHHGGDVSGAVMEKELEMDMKRERDST